MRRSAHLHPVTPRTNVVAVALIVLAGVLAACSPSSDEGEDAPQSNAPRATASATSPTAEAKGIEKIDHLVFIVMENRSFDHFFGTFPGADGFPKNVCVPDPEFGGKCQSEYHDTDIEDVAGPHTKPASIISVNGGKMDGFLEAATEQPGNECGKQRTAPQCADRVGPDGQLEVMGYHDQHEIPLYWQLAEWGVLQDKMFAPTDSWTLPAHLFLMSAWSAFCSDHNDPMSCESSGGGAGERPLEVPQEQGDTPYAWTDITYMLNKAGVSWGYYISPHGTCYEKECDLKKYENKTTGFQNPMPGFLTVKEDKTEKNIQPYTEYVDAAEAGTLPSVSWVMRRSMSPTTLGTAT